MRLDPASVREYVNRAWRLLEDSTELHRAEMYEQDPEWAWRTAAALREEVSRSNPAWPTAADREADFAHHVELCSILDRARRGLERRRRAR